MDFTVWTIVGIVASLLTSFSYVPQVRKMWRRKSVGDISNITIFQMITGCILWLLYGIGRRDPVIIGANIVALSILAIGTFLYYHYKVKDDNIPGN
jgi:MtN3 and saliva related transmembrane protein